MKKIYLLGLSTLGLALFFYTKKQIKLLQDIKYRLRSFRVVGKNAGTITLSYIIELTNNSNIDVSLSNVNAKIRAGKQLLGDVAIGQLDLPKNSVKSFPFTTQIDSKLLLNVLTDSVLELLTAKKIGVNVDLVADGKILGVTFKKMTFQSELQQISL